MALEGLGIDSGRRHGNFLFFEERTGPPVLRTDLKPKIFFSKNLVFFHQNEVFGYKHICTDMHRYMYICTDIALIHADIG